MIKIFPKNMKKLFQNIFIFVIVALIIYFVYSFVAPKMGGLGLGLGLGGGGPITKADIAALTNKWIYEVTVKHDPDAIGNLFCEDGNLVGTVSQIKRKGADISSYFDYFAKLPGIKVVDKKYNISQVSHDTWLNTAFITWSWDELDVPISARMTFLFKNKCIFQLHSSALPELNESLLQVSGTV
jgi:hypothetical protein